MQQALYQEIPYRLQAEGTYHNLGLFFDRISKFPRIISVSEISVRAKTPPDAQRHDHRRVRGDDLRAAGSGGGIEEGGAPGPEAANGGEVSSV